MVSRPSGRMSNWKGKIYAVYHWTQCWARATEGQSLTSGIAQLFVIDSSKL